MRKILLISLGCDKNRVDSEKMLGLLNLKGYEITDLSTMPSRSPLIQFWIWQGRRRQGSAGL